MPTKYYAEGPEPKVAKQGDAGIDLCYNGYVPMLMEGNFLYKIPTGVYVEIPSDKCGIIFERSGLGSKHGYKIHGRIIDSGYRGEVIVLASIMHGARVIDLSKIQNSYLVDVEVVKDGKRSLVKAVSPYAVHTTEMESLVIKPGDRVAQMVVVQYDAELVKVLSKSDFSTSERGTSGLGSTGK